VAETIVWTIGHSILSLEDFLARLAAQDIQLLADVRRYPTSRRYPHFDQDALRASLRRVGVVYRHFPLLGGRRERGLEPSPNGAWVNVSFRNFADYALGEPFRLALDDLVAQAQRYCTAILCAEAVPWHCHRGLIADHLLARGLLVQHILGPDKVRPHTLHPAAVVGLDGLVRYPVPGTQQGSQP
jgi:uncharacterized protein (DUF488 family)